MVAMAAKIRAVLAQVVTARVGAQEGQAHVVRLAAPGVAQVMVRAADRLEQLEQRD